MDPTSSAKADDGAVVFPFPFPPYVIQQRFMEAMHATILAGNCGVFESPTGTGKTLSLICSSITWLLAEEEHGIVKSDLEDNAPKKQVAAGPTAEEDWLTLYDEETAARRQRDTLETRRSILEELQQRLSRVRVDEAREVATKAKARAAPGSTTVAEAAIPPRVRGEFRTTDARGSSKRRREGHRLSSMAADIDGGGVTAAAKAFTDDSAFALEDAVSSCFSPHSMSEFTVSTAAQRAISLAAELRLAPSPPPAAQPKAIDAPDHAAQRLLPKIYFVTRTHSQVAQFVHEVARIPGIGPTLRVVALGARKQLCVNHEVRSLSSDLRINERCLELQDAKRTTGTGASAPLASTLSPLRDRGSPGTASSPATGCPFLANSVQGDLLKDRLLATARDIEDAVTLGESMSTCAYYASRRAVAEAQVVALPYSMLLHRGTRASLNLNLAGSVVILDEAHNVIDAINATHSSLLTLAQAASAHAQLRAYLERYRARLSRENLLSCTQLADFLGSLVRLLRGPPLPPRHVAAVSPPALNSEVTPVSSSGDCGASPSALPPGKPSFSSETDVPAQLLGRRTSVGGGASVGGQPASALQKQTSSALVSAPVANGSVSTLPEFMCRAGIDGVNVFSLVRYVDAVGLLRKLRGFAEAGLSHATVQVSSDTGEVGGQVVQGATGIEDGAGASTAIAVGALQAAYAFLTCLTQADADGRVIVQLAPAGSVPLPDGAGRGVPRVAFVKYILLNPAVHFREVVDAARSVILAGGTLHPVDDLVSQLFGHLPPRRVTRFACGHIIPRENLAAFVVPSGPGGVRWRFSFERRDDPALVDALGRALLNLAAVVPAGVVVFLPSYEYEARLLAAWQLDAVAGGSSARATATASRAASQLLSAAASSGGGDTRSSGGTVSVCGLRCEPHSVLARLATRKAVFREPRSSADVDSVLSSYAAAATGSASADVGGAQGGGGGGHGAILFSVVGGKMSEGINFSDDLARCVVVVGMPYPNRGSAELQERMRYLDARQAAARAAPEPCWPPPALVSPAPPASPSGNSAISATQLATPPVQAARSPLCTPTAAAGGVGGVSSHGQLRRTPSGGVSARAHAALAAAMASSGALGASAASYAAPGESQPPASMPLRSFDGPPVAPRAVSSGTTGPPPLTAGSEYYENLCMKAVNQSIGRSIRHRGDYAAILLLDERYTQPRIRGKLPSWIVEGLSGDRADDWGTAVAGVGRFFRQRRAAAGAKP